MLKYPDDLFQNLSGRWLFRVTQRPLICCFSKDCVGLFHALLEASTWIGAQIVRCNLRHAMKLSVLVEVFNATPNDAIQLRRALV